MASNRRLVILACVLLVAGAASTGLWLGAVQFPELSRDLLSVRGVASLAVCVAFTTANLTIRWFRWHFLIRRFTPELVTRESLLVYVATLPAIITPFFLGELVRVLLLKKRFQAPSSYLVRIWFYERLLDFGVLCTAFLFALDAGWGAVSAVCWIAGAGLMFGPGLPGRRRDSTVFIATAALLATACAWTLPVLALSATLELLSSPATLRHALEAFSAGTLFGALSGLPLGVFIAGSTMITELVSAGVGTQTAVLAILIYRAGTAWYAVCLGLACLFMFRHRLRRLLRGDASAHFDEIAHEYAGEIPAHVRERLLLKKVRLMDGWLAGLGIPRTARGLDLGCGQGWYLAEMRRLGYRVDGTDYSGEQLKKAELHLAASGDLGASFVRADAQALPFANESFDFVYSINALHHILSAEAQRRTLGEIVRVLRPGGVFLLHEMNTLNPLFRVYMGYVFPLLKKIDEGNEQWILPTSLPELPGADWSSDVVYFTFLPDFVPSGLLQLLHPLERSLEASSLRRYSAHYQACLVKRGSSPRRDSALGPADSSAPPNGSAGQHARALHDDSRVL